VIRIVKESAYTKRDEQRILEEARVRLGRTIRVSFEYVQDIPREKSGKYRFIVSTIDRKELFDQIIDP
jgi:phenylacetate-CoA ligase